MPQITCKLDLPKFEGYRVRLGLAKKDIAKSLGIHPGSLANWLSKARRGEPLPLSLICVLAFVMSCKPADLMIDPITIDYDLVKRKKDSSSAC